MLLQQGQSQSCLSVGQAAFQHTGQSICQAVLWPDVEVLPLRGMEGVTQEVQRQAARREICIDRQNTLPGLAEQIGYRGSHDRLAGPTLRADGCP